MAVRTLYSAATALICATFALACGSSNTPAPTGALDVVLLSDMALPKDLDRVRVQVTQRGRTLLKKENDVGPGELLLPAIF